MGRGQITLAAIAASLVLLVAINVLAATLLGGARLDLTDDKRFTLSPGTRTLLGNMEERVTLELYASRRALSDYPPLADHARRVEEMLGEYVRAAGDRLRLVVRDPVPFSEAEDEAVAAGVRGLPGPRRDSLIYLGLVGRGPGGDVLALPFLHPDEAPFLEYELSRLVQSLARPAKPRIGLLAGLALEDKTPENPFRRTNEAPRTWIALQTLRDNFELVHFEAGELERVPDDLEVLLVVHPKELPDAALYAIDQFVLRGGRLLAFVDPWCQHDEPPPDPGDNFGGLFADRSSNLDPLFEAWGVRMEKNRVAADAEYAQQVQFQGRGGRVEVGRYLPRLVLGKDAMNAQEVITRDLGRVVMWYAGVLEPVPGAGTEFTPLLQTSPRSSTIGVDKLRFGPDPAALLADFVSGDAQQTLAARVSGEVQSAFPGGLGGEAASGHLDRSRGPIQVLLVADVDVLADRTWAQRFDMGGQSLFSPTADNGALLLNSIDLLLGGSDLISLRGRTRVQRPFERVEEMRRAAEERFRAEEQRLVQEEERVGRRIDELVAQAGGSGVVLLPPEVQAEIAALRDERAETRRRLREVRHSLDRDVESLGSRLKWLHVGGLPLVVGLLAALSAAFASTRRKTRASVR